MNYYQEEPQKKAALLSALIFVIGIGLLVGVVFYIANGSIDSEARIEVVSVYNVTEETAKETLEGIGLEVEVFRVTNIEISKGLVYEQDPSPGAKVNEGELVTLYISEGGDRSPVPQVLGFDEVDAVRILTSSEYGYVVERTTEDSPAFPGVVVRQEPPRGELLATGDTVRIFVSSGTTRVPDFRNQPVESAIAQLQGLGLTVVQEFQPSEEILSGFVISSRPGPNLPVESDTVVLIVSSGIILTNGLDFGGP